MFSSTIVFTLASIPSVLCHLILNEPQVWGVSDGIALEQPLDGSTQNWMCAGQQPDTTAIINFVAGQSYNLQTICGEQDLDAPGCLVGDWHTGNSANDYSGCALSISYDDYTNPDNHRYLSYSQECPKRDTDTTFVISRNVQNCERCVCSWAWAPSRDYSSPAQYYHNCFYCSISGGSDGNATMRQFDFINVPGAAFTDATYNDINPDLDSGSPPPSTSTTPTTSSSSTSTTTSSSSTSTSTPSPVSTTTTSSLPTTPPRPQCTPRTVTVDVYVTPSPTCCKASITTSISYTLD